MRHAIWLLSVAVLACGGQRRDPEPPPPLEPIEPVPAPLTITGAGGTGLLGTATGKPVPEPVAVAQTDDSDGQAPVTGSGGKAPPLPHQGPTHAAGGTSMLTVSTTATTSTVPRIY